MPKVTNISNGPRGGYKDGELVMVERGQSADLDDYPEEWFARASSADAKEAAEAAESGEPAPIVFPEPEAEPAPRRTK